MNKIKLQEMAIEKLNSKEITNIKKQLCQMFINNKEKENCIREFDKSFIKSFIISYQNKFNNI